MVDTHDDDQKILKDLVNANLLEVDENEQFVKFQDLDKHILVNLIFQLEESRVFLMRGGLDFTEPPEVEEWESAKEACLMQTRISELLEEPRLISPAIGRLKQLEVFDLEGTKITNLPKEIESLINLTCLIISISGTEPSNEYKTVIPHGVISSLLHLEELNLDVDADVEWWYTCAEGVVSEVCNLKRLSTIKFSFPTLELLRQFNQLRKSMEHPYLAQIKLLIGNHANRIMNRLPSDVEFGLERSNRYLRYITGDGVFIDIKDILQQSDGFLRKCNELEVLKDAYDTMHQEALTESHCKSICLESIKYVYYMRNSRNIWKGSVQKGCLSSLKLLTLCKCPELTIIFSLEMLGNLNNLEEVTIEDCPAIKSLLTCQTSTGKVRETSYFLPILKKLSLH
ncbi:uncharacterized protein LOC130136618 [Syzygium oleosum]|uniref:uncharacterized protein LOC130136618 n=1 Tax=Syzygium oleosum TaxID=219896 RepID=UPI0024B93B03|nr:uncharacterized protein LOC130136618 [Syzygium oleosum]